ncbi:MAG: hypothetical protein SFZ02_12875 [bacterium]|nr:hypothetical protein [bacterium]
MTGSKYYFTWSIGYAIVIIGLICFITDTILWLGILPQLNKANTDMSFLIVWNTLINAIIVGCGYILLFIRKILLRKLTIIHETGLYESSKKFTFYGLIGGGISVLGVLWFFYANFRIAYSQNTSYNSILADISALPILIGISLIIIFIGQLIVLSRSSPPVSLMK